MACAWMLGKRVIACASVCGALPAAPGPYRKHLSPIYRLMLGVHDRAPWLLKGALVPLVRLARFPPPRPLLWLALRGVGPEDRAALWKRESFALYFPAFQNAMRSGMRGLWEDGDPYSSPWPFDPAEIRSSLMIWHGNQNKNFSWQGAEALAARLPGAQFHKVEEGHYSILGNRAHPILDSLLAPAWTENRKFSG